jgi:hypothetical protein
VEVSVDRSEQVAHLMEHRLHDAAMQRTLFLAQNHFTIGSVRSQLSRFQVHSAHSSFQQRQAKVGHGSNDFKVNDECSKKKKKKMEKKLP